LEEAVRPEPSPESTPRRYPVWIIVVALGIASFLAFLGIRKVRQQSDRVACSNNLKQLGLAAQMYLNDHRIFPYNLGEDAGEIDGLHAIFDGEYVDDPGMLACPVTCKPYRLQPDWEEGDDPSTDFILICRHRDGANVLFLQGNVKWVPNKELERMRLLETSE
jgi:hypothetical protein